SGENRVNARSHVKEGNNLCDLMDYVRNTGNKAHGYSPPIEQGSTAMSSVNQKRCDGQTGDKIPIKILRPRIVIMIQIVHEQRWRGPNKDRSKDSRVAF